MAKLSRDILRHRQARRLEGDRVELSQEEKATPEILGWFRQVASLTDDGNIIEDESYDPASTRLEKRRYSWARDAKGRCYLKSLRIERTFNNKRYSCIYYQYEVTSFDADYRPPRAIFDEKSIKPAPGTRVEDEVSGKRYRIGDRPVASVADTLDRLVPELQSRGFATRERHSR